MRVVSSSLLRSYTPRVFNPSDRVHAERHIRTGLMGNINAARLQGID